MPTDWTLTATGPTPITGADRSRRRSPAAPVQVGSYTSPSRGPAGYTAGAGSAPAAAPSTGSTVTLADGSDATCTITNTDQQAAADPGQDGDQRQRRHRGADRLDADRRRPDPDHRRHRQRRRSPTRAVSAGTLHAVRVRRPGRLHRRRLDLHRRHRRPARPSPSPLGGDVTCTITNDDQPAHADAGQDGDQRQRRHRRADRLDPDRRPARRRSPAPTGPRPSPTPPVDAGTYTLSESDGPAGYTAGDWTCTGGDR